MDGVLPGQRGQPGRPGQPCAEGRQLSRSTAFPDPALVVLVGPSGCGKSTWASTRYRGPEVVSSDALRAIVGSGEDDLD
ncbi:MAG TPA: AAA family ATPase, partial [Pedococcus sp.]|nr:AAA family ATPase [Pedococcus sp.]